MSILPRSALEIYYKNYCESPNSSSFVWMENQTVVGYLIGGIAMHHLNRAVAKKTLLTSPGKIIYLFVQSPRRVLNLLSESYSSYFKKKKKTFYKPDTAGLSDIGVDRQHRGKKIAESLVSEFLDDLRTRGVSACRLGVAAENIAAQRLYKKMGFESYDQSKTSYIYYFNNKYRKK